jgi:hypothetical protein
MYPTALAMAVELAAYAFATFLAGAVTDAIPGIILQLILIPLIMLALDRAKLVKFRK